MVRSWLLSALFGWVSRAKASNGAARTTALLEVIAGLDLLNQNTERDFLRIGENLTEFMDQVNQISAGLSVVAGLNSGRDGQLACQSLTYALDQSKDLAARFAAHNLVLNGMRQDAARLMRTLAGFDGTVSNFHTLGMLTRIETARLGSAGAEFGSLADDVSSLAKDVEGRVENALDTAVRLITSIDRALQRISALAEKQANELPAVIAGVSASVSSFESFRDLQGRAHDSSVRLGTQYSSIFEAFKKLIVSIQFHDLTRQQVEHVIETLRCVSGGTNGESGATILALQSSQLADAGQKFAASVASVTSSLSTIERRVQEVATDSDTLACCSGDSGGSFFLQMERGCAAGLASLNYCALADTANRDTGGDLTETIRQMHGSIQETQSIEIRMQWMALNASIRAAHLGAPGDALGILARSMQQQAEESGERSAILGEALRSMSAAAIRFTGPSEAVLHVADGEDRSIRHAGLEGIRSEVLEFHSTTERSNARIAQISDRAERLGHGLRAAREEFSVGALFAETVNRAREALKQIGDQHFADLGGDGPEDSNPGLSELSSHYTMQSEHDVHLTATRAAPLSKAMPPLDDLEPSSQDAEALGENVEFF